jgi:ferric-chelate reductase
MAPACFVFLTRAIYSVHRLLASEKGQAWPARPSNMVMKWIATTTAIVREASYLQFTPINAESWVRIPNFGSILMIASYFGFILILEFVGSDLAGAQHYQARSVHAAWLAVAQIPLIVLLAGKTSLIGFLSGTSYQRLNVLHRWVARGLLLLATLHFGFESYGWNQYGLMQLEWATDTCPPTGIATYSIVLWMNLTTLAPIRFSAYNLFVVQHLLTYFGFIIALMMHIPSTALYARTYVYIAIALYLVERLVRSARYAYNNIRPGRATLQALAGGATKVYIANPRVKNWTAGSHVLLAIPKFGLAQSHPATILSSPQSHNGDLVLILRTFTGFTRRMSAAADSESSKDPEATSEKTYFALIEGPYPAASQTDFACYDVLFLLAGGTGVTFTLSVLLGITSRAKKQKIPLRVIQFVWIVKNRRSLSWIHQELLDALPELQNAGIEIQTKAFLTCDNGERDSECNANPAAGCQCAGECCCEYATDKITKVQSGPSRLDNSEEEKSLSQPLWTTVQFQRPSIDSLLWQGLCEAEGETAIAVSGPLRLCAAARTTVVKISDERAVHKGTGAQGIYLHVENCQW